MCLLRQDFCRLQVEGTVIAARGGSVTHYPSDNICINLPRKANIFEPLLGRERYLMQPFEKFILLASSEVRILRSMGMRIDESRTQELTVSKSAHYEIRT